MYPALTVAGALLVAAQVHRFGGGVIASELNRVFGLGAAEIGLIIGVMALASSLVQIPMGLALDRFGTRVTVSSTAVIALLGTLILALAGGAPGLILGRFLIGVGLAAVVTSLLLLTMRWAPAERYASVAATVMGAASMVGGLLATVPLGYLLQTAGWRATFLGLSLVTLVMIGLCYTLIRDGPPGEGPPRAAASESLTDSVRGLLAVLSDANVLRILAMSTCVIAPFMCVGGLWAGPYLEVVYGFDPGQASWVLLAMITTANVGTFAYGPLDRWFGGRRKVVLGGAVASIVTLIALALWPTPPVWIAIAILLMFALVSPFYVTLTAHSRSFVPVDRAGRLITTINLVALGTAFVAQWLTGLLVALPGGGGLGTELGFRLAFGFIALMLLVATLVYRPAPEHQPA
ncbi:MAG: MFS transporter [Pseudomonadota bacterium]